MFGMFDSVLDTIGKTPLVKFTKSVKGLPCPVYGKVEFFNPGASIKDRIGRFMIEKAEQEGLIQPGVTTIVEATAGNTGVGLALVASVKGYRCIFVLPDKMSAEKIQLLQAYGAETVIVPTNVPLDSPDSYGSVAKRLLNEIPNAWQPNQFENMNNPEIHYLTTGPEIWEQTNGKVTCFVSGIGTGGTISGIGKYLKERNPDIKIVGADPEGSILSGGQPQAWKVEGIGEDYVPKTFNGQVVDDWVRVSDRESFQAARKISRQEGLLIGGSSGTCVAAALRYAERLTADDLVVVILPDTGRNYLSKVFNDDWMREQGYLDDSEKKRATAKDVIEMLGDRNLLCLSPENTVQDAIEMCRDRSISQIPIIENNQVVGGIQEVALARVLHDGIDPPSVKLGNIMARALPEIDGRTGIDEVFRLLMSGNTGVLVRSSGKLTGIITRIDLVNFWDVSSPAQAATV